jgi:hypothetical protein
MAVSKFIVRIFMEVYRRSLASHTRIGGLPLIRLIDARDTGHHLGMVPESWIGANHSFAIMPTTELLALTPNGNIYLVFFFSGFA